MEFAMDVEIFFAALFIISPSTGTRCSPFLANWRVLHEIALSSPENVAHETFALEDSSKESLLRMRAVTTSTML